MRFGTETGSLINHVMSNNSVDSVEEIIPGETGATYLSWTDRHACTVIDVFKMGKYNYIRIQKDIAQRIDNHGMSEDQEYEYSRDPDGAIWTFRVTEKGFEQVRHNSETGRFNKITGGCGLMVGKREQYHDFSF